MITFPGCKHLIFDKTKIDKRIKLVALPKGMGAYWKRDKELLDLPIDAVNVQFCYKRGRLNSKVACLKDMAECQEYEEVTHEVEPDIFIIK